MKHAEETLFKDVTILDEVDIVDPQIEFTLIYNDEAGKKEQRLQMPHHIKLERLVTYVIDSVAERSKLPLPRVNSFKSFAILIRNALVNSINSVSKPTRYSNLVYDLRGVEPNNISHLMLEIIPICLHVRNVTNQDVHFLLDKVAEPFQKLLDVFGISPILTYNQIDAPLVKVVATKELAAYDLSVFFEMQTFKFLLDIYDGYKFSSGLEGMEKIFIARRGARGLLNLAEVEALLDEYGYKTIFMEDYSMEVKLGIAAEAKDIVAIQGAAMGLFAINKRVNTLIEIAAPSVYHSVFPATLGQNVKKYIQIMPYFDSRALYNEWGAILEQKSRSFTADIEQLAEALKSVS